MCGLRDICSVKMVVVWHVPQVEVLKRREEVEEVPPWDLEGGDEVPLLEDAVGDARQHAVVLGQVADAEHVQAPRVDRLQALELMGKEKSK